MTDHIRAFPIPNDTSPGAYPTEPGMDLRDYFAAHAMQGLLANPEVNGTAATIASEAYEVADQMMVERSHD